MRYPINREAFIKLWLDCECEPDESDNELAEAVVDALNAAYEAGLRDGKAGTQYE